MVDVSELCEDSASFIGKSINTKDKEGWVMVLATPTDRPLKEKRYVPLSEQWSQIAPNTPGNFAPLFPFFEKDFPINSIKKSTDGAAQVALTRLEEN